MGLTVRIKGFDGAYDCGTDCVDYMEHKPHVLRSVLGGGEVTV